MPNYAKHILREIQVDSENCRPITLHIRALYSTVLYCGTLSQNYLNLCIKTHGCIAPNVLDSEFFFICLCERETNLPRMRHVRQTQRFFGIELLKIYLIGNNVTDFENKYGLVCIFRVSP